MASFVFTTLLFVCVACGQALDELAPSCSTKSGGGTADSACSSGSVHDDAHDDVSAMQLRHSSDESTMRARKPTLYHPPDPENWVICPGSRKGPGRMFKSRRLYENTHCMRGQCCPGTVATEYKNFPCPLSPDMEGCQGPAPKEIKYTLVVTTCRLNFTGNNASESLNTLTRCYNGTVPGPTLHFEPGSIVTIHLHNTLQGPNPPPMLVNISSDFNESDLDQREYGIKMQEEHDLDNTYTEIGTGSPYGHINSTNLHVHGIVVPGHQPADDVLITVMPNHSYKFAFNIPTYHMPGTHWYHPHRHHSTGAQVNGGLFGMIVMKDTKTVIPPEYLEAEELMLPMDTLKVEIQRKISRLSHDDLWQNAEKSQGFFTLVDGKLRPTYTLHAGRWYRLRLVYAAEFRALRPVLDNFAGKCQLKLIAKDGVYLNVAPRTVEAMWLAPGNTADVMIACSCDGSATSCSTKMLSSWDTKRPAANTGDFNQSSAYTRTFDGELLNIKIIDDKKCSLPVLRKFKVKRPCYLVDLTNATVFENNTHEVFLKFNGIHHDNEQTFSKRNVDMYFINDTDDEDIVENNTAYFSFQFDTTDNRFMHDDQEAMTTPTMKALPMEQVQEWNISSVNFHPLHMHVVPYQIMALDEQPYRVEPGPEEWDQIGDWHDTLFTGMSPTAKIRFVFRLKGIDKLIMHCHFLNHEDQGLMTYFNVTDSECVHPSQCAQAIVANTTAGTCFMNYNNLTGPGYELL